MTFYCFTVSGVFKLLTIFAGSAAFGLGAYSYDETIVQEEFFLRTVQTALIVSVIDFGIFLAVSTKLERSDIALALDIAFHVITAVTLPIAAGLVIYSTVDNDRTYCQLIFTVFPHLFCQFYGIKMAAGIITLCNGAFYWITAATVFFSKTQPRNPCISRSIELRNPIFSIPVDPPERSLGPERPRSFYYGTKH